MMDSSRLSVNRLLLILSSAPLKMEVSTIYLPSSCLPYRVGGISSSKSLYHSSCHHSLGLITFHALHLFLGLPLSFDPSTLIYKILLVTCPYNANLLLLNLSYHWGYRLPTFILIDFLRHNSYLFINSPGTYPCFRISLISTVMRLSSQFNSFQGTSSKFSKGVRTKSTLK